MYGAPSELAEAAMFRKIPNSGLGLQQLSQDFPRSSDRRWEGGGPRPAVSVAPQADF